MSSTEGATIYRHELLQARQRQRVKELKAKKVQQERNSPKFCVRVDPSAKSSW